MNSLCALVLCFVLVKCVNSAGRLYEKYNWKQLDYEYPSQYARQQALERGEFQPENVLPLGMGNFREKLFVSIPRVKDGIPATLAYIDTNKTPSGSPKLIPYPSWAANRFGDCENGLQYVFRHHVDKCNRLWVYDAGYSGFFPNRTQVCRPAIVAFDLETNVRILRHELKPEDSPAATIVSNIAVDIGQNCDDSFAYLADPMTFAILVYSLATDELWRFHNSYFFPDPLNSDFNVDGFNYQWEIGVQSMVLSERKPNGYRTLYFTPQTSRRNFNVSTRILRDKTRVSNSYHDFNVMNERGEYGRLGSQDIDELSGVVIFSIIDETAVGCWHTSLPYSPENLDIVEYNENLLFVNDIKVDANHNVWIFNNRMPKFFLGKLNYSEINFRIYTAPVDELVDGTRCNLRPKASTNNRFGYYDSRFDNPITTPITNNKRSGLVDSSQLSRDDSGWSVYPEWWTKHYGIGISL